MPDRSKRDGILQVSFPESLTLSWTEETELDRSLIGAFERLQLRLGQDACGNVRWLFHDTPE